MRFPELAASVTRFDRDAFFQGLRNTATIELIEVKGSLNRFVFGQLLAARELVVDAWGEQLAFSVGLGVDLRLTAVVGQTDAALEPVCARNGIRVVLLADAAPEDIDDAEDEE